MDRKELQDLIADVQFFKSEFDHVELKAANGGIIIYGIDENQDYEVVGVYDVNDLQKQLVNQAERLKQFCFSNRTNTDLVLKMRQMVRIFRSKLGSLEQSDAKASCV